MITTEAKRGGGETLINRKVFQNTGNTKRKILVVASMSNHSFKLGEWGVDKVYCVHLCN